jgi:hypothetical protein
MSPSAPLFDLLALVADLDMELSILGILTRHEALRIRPVEVVVHRHPQRDSGCCTDGVAFLRPFANQYRYALLMFDHEGCGRAEVPATIECQLEADLAAAGWQGRSAVIILEPELEAWVWSDSPHVAHQLGWRGQEPSLQSWLIEKRFLQSGQLKPDHPKEALEAALQEVRKARTPSLYKSLAEKVSMTRCSDRSFTKLRDKLRRWFGRTSDLRPRALERNAP